MPSVRAAIHHVRADRGGAVLCDQEGWSPRGLRPAEAVHRPEEGHRKTRHLTGAPPRHRRRHRGGAEAIRPGRDPERGDRRDGHGPPARPGRGRIHPVRLGLPRVHGPPAGQERDRTGPELAPHVGPRESVVLVPALGVGRLVSDLRSKHDPSATAGVPPHLTLMFPFVPPTELTEGTIDLLASLMAATAGFDFALIQVREFEGGVVYLEPDPAAPFMDLTQRIGERFALLPFGG